MWRCALSSLTSTLPSCHLCHHHCLHHCFRLYEYFECDIEEVDMAFLFSSGFLFMSYKWGQAGKSYLIVYFNEIKLESVFSSYSLIRTGLNEFSDISRLVHLVYLVDRLKQFRVDLLAGWCWEGAGGQASTCVKVKVWKWKCESENVRVKVWVWKSESENGTVKVISGSVGRLTLRRNWQSGFPLCFKT